MHEKSVYCGAGFRSTSATLACVVTTKRRRSSRQTQVLLLCRVWRNYCKYETCEFAGFQSIATVNVPLDKTRHFNQRQAGRGVAHLNAQRAMKYGNKTPVSLSSA